MDGHDIGGAWSPGRRALPAGRRAARGAHRPAARQRAARLLDKEPPGRPTVEEALALLGEQQPVPADADDRTKVLPSAGIPAGATVAVAGGAAALLAGIGAVALAFGGVAVLMAMADVERGDRIWVIPSIVIAFVVLLTTGWAWEMRRRSPSS